MCLLKKCFCLDLPTAGVCIGVFGVLISIPFIYLGFANDSDVSSAILWSRYIPTQYGFEWISIMYSVEIALGILDISTSILLIIGSMGDSQLMLYPWLLVNFFSWTIKIPMHYVFFLTMFLLYNKDVIETPGLFLMIGTMAVLLLLHIWKWLTIHSLCQMFRSSSDENHVANTKPAAEKRFHFISYPMPVAIRRYQENENFLEEDNF